MKLKDQTALVTGASRGIGEAIARALAVEGAQVAITGRSKQELEALKKEFRGLGVRCESIVADLTHRGAVEQVWQQTTQAFGHVDILVNNAGVTPRLGLPFTRQDEGDWDKVFNINVKSVFFMCKAIAPHFMERRSGKIINISSIAGPLSSQTMPSYSVSKMGVITFTKIVAKELAGFNVNVNAICPGLLYTDMWKNIGEVIRETNPSYAGLTPRQMFERRVQEWIPLRREQTPEDIGHAVVFLASDEARSITGQALMVDGGCMM